MTQSAVTLVLRRSSEGRRDSNDPDGKVAESILKAHESNDDSTRAILAIEVNGERIDGICSTDELPADPFTLVLASLNDPNLIDDALEQLQRLTGLKTLTLVMQSGPKVTETQMQHAERQMELVGRLQTLESLRVDGQGITPPMMRAFRGLPNLFHLKIRGIRTSSSSLEQLAAIPLLRSLDLRDVNLGDARVVELSKMTQLELIDLRSTDVTADGLKALRKSLPNCKIIHESITTE